MITESLLILRASIEDMSGGFPAGVKISLPPAAWAPFVQKMNGLLTIKKSTPPFIYEAFGFEFEETKSRGSNENDHG
jgi:hypothetical protein